ncbi:hypothetical protein Zm00014a_033458 [Zea mays]|uniref:Uncharacterized protein n=1 Tax=Zea mays TaxID=4577 RepID=A0A317YH24_MAIZE|nr:hypothetical protein Zm00014a_033458 [Zea mays]
MRSLALMLTWSVATVLTLLAVGSPHPPPQQYLGHWMMFPVCNFFEQARTENQVVQKSTCDFEGLMVSNRGYDEVHITRGCKKIDI